MHGETDDVMKYRFTLKTGDKFDCSAFNEEAGFGVTLYQAAIAKNIAVGYATQRPVTIVIRMGYYYHPVEEYEHPYYVELKREVASFERPRTA